MIWLLIWLIIKKVKRVVTELFIRDRKLNFSIGFTTQSYFKVPKEVRLNTHIFYYENFKEKRTSTNSIKPFNSYRL